MKLLDILHSLPSLDYKFGTLGSRSPETWPNWFVSEDVYPFYEIISRIIRPKNYLEIGALVGYSLISVLHGCEDVEGIYWVDNESAVTDSNRICNENLDFYLNNYYTPPRNLYRWWSGGTFQLFRFIGQSWFDLIHIDGDHTFLGCLGDLLLTYFMNPKYVIVDDMDNPQVRRAVAHWSGTRNLPFFEVINSKGQLAVFDLYHQLDMIYLLEKRGVKIRID